MRKSNLVFGRTDNFFVQFFRYFFVGGFAFVYDFFFLYFFTEFVGIAYYYSAIYAFIIGLSVNYVISSLWVFGRSKSSVKFELFVFLVTGIFGVVFNEMFILFFTEIVGLYYLVSKLISTFLVLFWNFLSRKVVLFRR